MSLLLTLNLMMSLIFITLTHPLSMGLILLAQTITISMITGFMNYNTWYSYILFLIFIGGMLILFMYMTSIASNEKFNLEMKSLFVLLPLMAVSPSLFWISTLYITNNETIPFMNNYVINTSMNKYINFPSNMITMFIIMYLLLTLIAVVKITNFKSGPLRQMN